MQQNHQLVRDFTLANACDTQHNALAKLKAEYARLAAPKKGSGLVLGRDPLWVARAPSPEVHLVSDADLISDVSDELEVYELSDADVLPDADLLPFDAALPFMALEAPHAYSVAYAEPIPVPGMGPMQLAKAAELSVELDDASESNLYVGLSGDIAEGGIFVATYAPRAVGERLQVVCTMVDRLLAVQCVVEVAWVIECRPELVGVGDHVTGMGLRFLGLSPKDLATFDNFVDAREPLIYPR